MKFYKNTHCQYKSKKEDKDHESIQSSITPDPGYWERTTSQLDITNESQDPAGMLLSLAVLSATQDQDLLSSTFPEFSRSLKLDPDGKYTVYWANNETHIAFDVHVQTKGYVAFGISTNGKMFPADVVIGWVKDGTPYFYDYHITGYATPKLDKSQDWFLLKGQEKESETILTFIRELDTCDPEDIAINDQTNRLIYAYHPDDPTNETSPTFHGMHHHGTKSVSLLSFSKPPALFNENGQKMIEIRNRNFKIPPKTTTYLCTGFQMPDLEEKHHIIAFESVITPGSESLVHHMQVQRCLGHRPDLDTKTRECNHYHPKDWPKCTDVMAAWAVGGGTFYFPSDAGLAVEGGDANDFYMLQIHYNNPTHKDGVFDSSGMRLKLTSQLRQYDVGAIQIGYTTAPQLIVPPHEEAFISRGYCASSCTEHTLNGTNATEIKVIATLQHAHTLATGITTRHFRNGTELEPLVDDPYYDFFLQEIRPMKMMRTILPGDSFIVECTYNSKSRNVVTYGGPSTTDEMCEALLLVYPKPPLLLCTSTPFLDTMINATELVERLDNIDWNDSHMREEFKQNLTDSTSLHRCMTSTNGHTKSNFYAFKESVQPFVRQDPNEKCQARPNM